VGPPLDGVELRAGNEADGPAEIRVRGPTVAGALFRGPAAAAIPLTDSEGWYATGDLGLLDEEGHLWVTGRLSERIISGGVNVDPAEVEAVLLAHPGVREVAVVGVPDPEWGERVLAAVVPVDPAAPPTLDDLLDHARPRLLPAKRPRALLVLPELPRTPTGKLDRRRLGTEAGSGGGPSPSPGRPVS
jgi:acyl-CoA synthetase (AMP-forming)/AMP-acid ligase II